MRGDELIAERTVHFGSFDLGVLVGEELRYRGRDEATKAPCVRPWILDL